MTNRPDLAGLTLNVEVLQARDLIAKDRNLLGKRTTSDPYVKVQIKDQIIGKTRVVSKSLNPVWNQRFQFKLGADSAARLVQPEHRRTEQPQVALLTIWDQDSVGEDDIMGTVVIVLDPLENTTTKWYAVGKGSGTTFCHNAKGELQVKISFEGQRMMQVSRGQAHTLLYNRIRIGLAWDVERGQEVDLDSSIVAVDRHGLVLLNDTVYYGNLANSNLSIQHSGDELTGDTIGDDEKILLELDKIPSKILALYILLTVATPGKTFKDVRSAKARFIATETRQGICSYVPHEMGGENTALFLCRLSRQATTSWVLTPIEEGDKCARDFGSLIPEIKGYTRDLIPDIIINPQERIAIMRKGGTIRVSDYVPGGKIPAQVSFGLAWDVTNGVNIDLDASAILLDSNYQLLDLVSFKQLVSKDGSIRHSGDEREGDEAGDDEIINISLYSVTERTKYIGFIINSFSGQELDDVAKASCHLFDPKTKTDIATYTLSNGKELDKHTAVIMGCLFRGDNPSDWYLRIISLPSQGLVAQKNVDDLQTFLLCNPPQAPASHPEEEIVVTSMPDAVPVEEEIVVVPQSDFRQYTVPIDEEIVL
jgi:tellurium resistance protein TerZ